MLLRAVIAALSLAWLSACTQEPDSFTFAVVTDIQYATKETHGSRRYSEGLGKLREAVSAISARSSGLEIDAPSSSIINGITSSSCLAANSSTAASRMNMS